MEQMENKHWTVVIVIAFIGLSFWWLDRSWKTDDPVNIETISYEMPRPKLVGPEYDISGRKIVYNLTETERRIKTAAQGNAKADAKVAVPKTPAQDAKAKNAAKQAAAAAEAKKKAAKQAAAAAKRKAQLGVRIVDAGLEFRGGLKVNSISDSTTPSTPNSNQVVDGENKEAPLPNAAKDEDPKKTAEEWRALLFNAPRVVKNGVEFYKAYQSKEITADDFYKITGDLLSDTASDRQALALSIFKLDASERTFTVLVSHYTDRTPEALRKQIYANLRTYGDLPRFGILSNLIGSRNSRVVELATKVLMATVEAQKNLGQSSSNEGVLSPRTAAIPPKSFEQFLKVLRPLINGKDADAIKSLMASIEALMTSTRTA